MHATHPRHSTHLASRLFWPTLLGITALHLILAHALPPVEDELYYWAWAQTPQASYYDHPPMVAWLIAFSELFFGPSLWGIRFFACLSCFVVCVVLRRLCGGGEVLLLGLFTPILFLGGLLMTPDVPLALFWTLYAAWLSHLATRIDRWHQDPVSRVYRSQPIPFSYWALGGIVLGLGLLSKYSMALVLPCTLLFLVTRYRLRAWVMGFTLQAIVAGVVSSPILLFNIRHGFAPFSFQWGHALGASSPEFGQFFLSQVALFGLLPFFILPWALIDWRALCEEPRLRACLYLFVPPFLFFLVRAVFGRLEANWALPAYLTFWPIATYVVRRCSFHSMVNGMLTVSFALPVLLTAALLWHAFFPIRWLPPQKDRLSRLKSQHALALQITRDLKAMEKADPVLAPSYQWTSYLRFHGIAAQQLHPQSRPSQFTLQAPLSCGLPSAVVLEPAQRPPLLSHCFSEKTVLKEYPLVVRGVLVDVLRLTHYRQDAHVTQMQTEP